MERDLRPGARPQAAAGAVGARARGSCGRVRASGRLLDLPLSGGRHAISAHAPRWRRTGAALAYQGVIWRGSFCAAHPQTFVKLTRTEPRGTALAPLLRAPASHPRTPTRYQAVCLVLPVSGLALASARANGAQPGFDASVRRRVQHQCASARGSSWHVAGAGPAVDQAKNGRACAGLAGVQWLRRRKALRAEDPAGTAGREVKQENSGG